MIRTKRYLKEKRIALIFSSLEIGGTQHVMLRLMNGFIKVGLKVDAVVIKSHGPLMNKIPAEAKLVDLHAKRTLTAIPALVIYLRKNRPDAVLAGLTHINIATIIACFLSQLNTRLIVSEQSNLTQKKIHANKFWDRLIYSLIDIFYPFADAVVTVSHDAALDLINSTKLDPHKIIPIQNPIPVNEIRKNMNEKINHSWLVKKQIQTILAVGRFSQPKDYPTLINAFNYLHQRRRVRLIIIGEGEERPKIEQQIFLSPFADDIILMGRIENPYPYMARADVFVLSSAWEGFGLVIAEALACGATVVSTDCHSGPAEILGNGKYGRLVPVGDAEALADAIAESLDHPFPRAQSIARAREFSVEKAVEQYLKILLPDHNSEIDKS